MTYLNVPYLEEFMLHLIYFVPLFISSGFALMGLDEVRMFTIYPISVICHQIFKRIIYLDHFQDLVKAHCLYFLKESFNFVFYSALGLTTTLFMRYSAELAYIYAYDWSAFRLKTPSLFLNIFVDFIFVATLFFYACHQLRDPDYKKEKLAHKRNSSTRYHHQTPGTPGTPGPLLSSTPTNNSNIHNEFRRENVKNSNKEAVVASSSSYASTSANKPKRKGIGYGAEEGDALHYPISPVDKETSMKPLPPLPAKSPHDSEFDDISLPPHVPLASPEFDDV